MMTYMSVGGARYPKQIGIGLGIGATVAIAAILYRLRTTHDVGLELLLVLPVVVAARLSGRTAGLVVAFGAVIAFHLSRITQLHRSEFSVDALAAATFLTCALVVGAAIGGQADRLEVAARHEEQRRARELSLKFEANQERLAALEQVDQQRVALLRSVSHDLRTPLATIRALSTDLRDHDTHDQATRHELLDTVTCEAERLDRLVSNLLNMSRIEAGCLRVDSQAVDLAELVHLALVRDRHVRLLAHTSVDVHIDPELPLVAGDAVLLDEIIGNLLENTSRYAPVGSAVSLIAKPTTHDQVMFRIIDHGPGVSADQAAHLFEPFWSSRPTRSSGLGLAIVHAVAEAHGGTLRYSATRGGGATFEVRLPRFAGDLEKVGVDE
jgi:K+-sensing histidine kinase KdpD